MLKTYQNHLWSPIPKFNISLFFVDFKQEISYFKIIDKNIDILNNLFFKEPK